MLLAILSGQRGQTLHLLEIFIFSGSSVKIIIGDLLKTSNPKIHLEESNFSSYKIDNDVCVVHILSNYSQQTKQLRGSITMLFITIQWP